MPPLEEKIAKLSRGLLGLDPGPLAELRRMDPGGAGVPAYWRLANECGFRNSDVWMQIVKIMAMLTPKGQRNGADRLHDTKRRLGTVLCDGGNSGWPGDRIGSEPRPFLSETRLARFLACPSTQRGEALERMARMLAASRDPASGIDCAEIAALLLLSDHRRTPRNVARDYYGRLDAAARNAKEKEPEQ